VQMELEMTLAMHRAAYRSWRHRHAAGVHIFPGLVCMTSWGCL